MKAPIDYFLIDSDESVASYKVNIESLIHAYNDATEEAVKAIHERNTWKVVALGLAFFTASILGSVVVTLMLLR